MLQKCIFYYLESKHKRMYTKKTLLSIGCTIISIVMLILSVHNILFDVEDNR